LYAEKHTNAIEKAGMLVLNMWVDMVFGVPVPDVEQNQEFQHYLESVLLPTAQKSRRMSRKSISFSLSEFNMAKVNDYDSDIDDDKVENFLQQSSFVS